MIKPLCVILPQMSGYIKYFENGRKNMSSKTEDEDVYLKYNEIWNKIRSILNVKFHSQPIYDDKYIKTKVKTFNNTINTERIQRKNSLCLYFSNLYRFSNEKKQKKLSSSIFRTMQVQNKNRKNY